MADDKPVTPPAAPATQANPHVRLETSRGDIVLELFPDRSPLSVANFLRYADEGYYEGTIFDRVLKTPRAKLIDGGYHTPDLEKKTQGLHEPIKIESPNGLQNVRGTIAYERVMKPDTARSHFFINVADNPGLNYKAPNPAGWGFTVFGRVIEGMDVVDKIYNVELIAHPKQFPTAKDVPQTPKEPVVIKAVRRIDSP